MVSYLVQSYGEKAETPKKISTIVKYTPAVLEVGTECCRSFSLVSEVFVMLFTVSIVQVLVSVFDHVLTVFIIFISKVVKIIVLDLIKIGI